MSVTKHGGPLGNPRTMAGGRAPLKPPPTSQPPGVPCGGADLQIATGQHQKSLTHAMVVDLWMIYGGNVG